MFGISKAQSEKLGQLAAAVMFTILGVVMLGFLTWQAIELPGQDELMLVTPDNVDSWRYFDEPDSKCELCIRYADGSALRMTEHQAGFAELHAALVEGADFEVLVSDKDNVLVPERADRNDRVYGMVVAGEEIVSYQLTMRAIFFKSLFYFGVATGVLVLGLYSFVRDPKEFWWQTESKPDYADNFAQLEEKLARIWRDRVIVLCLVISPVCMGLMATQTGTFPDGTAPDLWVVSLLTASVLALLPMKWLLGFLLGPSRLATRKPAKDWKGEITSRSEKIEAIAVGRVDNAALWAQAAGMLLLFAGLHWNDITFFLAGMFYGFLANAVLRPDFGALLRDMDKLMPVEDDYSAAGTS